MGRPAKMKGIAREKGFIDGEKATFWESASRGVGGGLHVYDL